MPVSLPARSLSRNIARVVVNWKTTRLRESRCAGRRGVFRDGAGVDVDAEEFGGVEEHEDVGAEVDDGCLNGADESDRKSVV